MNFDKYKFRPSSVGNLMVEPRSKSETLSQTTKSFLQEIYLKEKFGREKIIGSKYMQKGNEVEEDSLTLATRHFSKLLIKNKETFENDWIKGTPDVVSPMLLDIKSSWDLFTFYKVESNPMYYWQLLSYMWLTGNDKATLCYCLVDSPEHQIYQETRRAMYSLNLADEEGTPEFDKMENQVRLNMTFGDIPEKMRVKTFVFSRDDEQIENLKLKITAARAYLQALEMGGLSA